MDDKMLEEMLNDISSMTSEEYLAFFKESQKLPDFVAFVEPIEAASYSIDFMNEVSIPVNITQESVLYSQFSSDSNFISYIEPGSRFLNFSDSKDIICPKVA